MKHLKNLFRLKQQKKNKTKQNIGSFNLRPKIRCFLEKNSMRHICLNLAISRSEINPDSYRHISHTLNAICLPHKNATAFIDNLTTPQRLQNLWQTGMGLGGWKSCCFLWQGNKNWIKCYIRYPDWYPAPRAVCENFMSCLFRKLSWQEKHLLKFPFTSCVSHFSFSKRSQSKAQFVTPAARAVPHSHTPLVTPKFDPR